MAGTTFHILTGFLGSGKTTLLLDFLATPEAADTAVLVNDAGAINVDGAVVAASAGDQPVALLGNGCVCCSVGSELAITVERLMHDRAAGDGPPFRRMILECSGLSRPGPIIRSLADLGAFDFRLRVLATFDAGQGAAHTENFEEAAAQLAAAQTVVLSKLDAPGAPSADAGTAAVHALAPIVDVVAEPDRRRRALAAFAGHGAAAVATETMPRAGGLGGMRHPRIGVFLAHVPPSLTWDAVALWIEDLAARCGDRLLRVKGVVAATDVEGLVLVQAVGTMFSPPLRLPRGTGGTPGAVVLITRDLAAAAIREASQPHGIDVAEA
jgi:G3E family GTPase